MSLGFVVSGSSGFIGSAFCRYIESLGDRVLRLTRSTRCIDGNSISYSEFLAGSSTKVKNFEPDIFVNCSAIAHKIVGLSRSRYTEAQIFDVNSRLPVTLAKVCESYMFKRYIFLSSVGVHGSSSSVPLTETSPYLPENIYSASKIVAECSLREFAYTSPLDLVILRPTLVYGPGCPGNLSFLKQLIDIGFPLPLKGVFNMRSFLYLDNLLDALHFLSLHSNSSGHSFLISDSEIISSACLSATICELRDSRSMFLPLPPLLVSSLSRFRPFSRFYEKLSCDLFVDTTKLVDQFNWVQPFSQSEGLARSFSINS
ncbi:NAD-dependent epimerase/dehydratase family protein [Parasynechococcus marenigrum]|uniref:Possible UDP-glucose 4-epimerase n=1 Tax=Parasynechococcus marenigrum (strain WH8102) TaxID=84588 RepID=Q7U900_PARMW|nr:NAD-dependent epimerase/dehydratase family protein [Parasynechococcus marenigrum]CAE06974.1 possible UDP-glucose 4-epimerase [Parasynechococcus marenigrum WH 8102]